ncbi:MAG: polysaccharide biosynthesis protein [Deltaproteobacteria bacterium]|nr:polysaccharide biosynthesis protein [Deltaproteobacteria bacterium]
MLGEHLKDKIIVVTGAAGTVGRCLFEKLLELEPAEIRPFDNNESELFLLGQEYASKGNVNPFLGDIRDLSKLEQVFEGADIVFHLAAHKHVFLAEYNPFDTVQTNINGVQNVIQAAIKNKVKKVVFTSSDKAVNPTSVMGTTKLMGERLIAAANIISFKSETVLSSCRFGNVLGSRGSVVPIFMNQIMTGGPITITDKRMTRFFMSIPQAAEFVLKSAELAKGGEVFVPKMPVMRIVDLAKSLIELLAPKYGYDPETVELKYIGAKPGEKMYEELMTQDEASRALELADMFAILPAFSFMYRHVKHTYTGAQELKEAKAYISRESDALPLEDLKRFLTRSLRLE